MSIFYRRYGKIRLHPDINETITKKSMGLLSPPIPISMENISYNAEIVGSRVFLSIKTVSTIPIVFNQDDLRLISNLISDDKELGSLIRKLAHLEPK